MKLKKKTIFTAAIGWTKIKKGGSSAWLRRIPSLCYLTLAQVGKVRLFISSQLMTNNYQTAEV
jgi:hypothetical protein